MASPLATVLASAYQPPGQFRPGTVAPTNVGDIVAQSQDAAYKTYAAQLQKQNAMFGGLAGLGSAGVLAFGPKLQGALFGTPKPGAPGLFSNLFSGFGSLGSAPAAANAVGGAGSVMPLADAMGTGVADAGLPAAIGSDAAAAGLLGAGTDVAAADAAATAAAAAPIAADAGFSLADALPLLFMAA